MINPPVAVSLTRPPAIGMVFRSARVLAVSEAGADMVTRHCSAKTAVADAAMADLVLAERPDAAPRTARVRTVVDLGARMAGAASERRDSREVFI